MLSLFVSLLIAAMMLGAMSIAQPAVALTLPAPSAEARDLWQRLRADYTAVDYSQAVNEQVSAENAIRPPLRQLPHSTEALEVRTELTKELKRPPTPQEHKDRFAILFPARLNLRAATDAVKQDLDTLMPLLLEQAAKDPSIDEAFLRGNKNAIVLGLAYIRHYYGFAIGGRPTVERLIEASTREPFIKVLVAMATTNLRPSIDPSGPYTNLTAPMTDAVYTRHLAPLTGAATITDYIRTLLDRYEGGTTGAQWLRDTAKAIIVDEGPVSLFDKLAADQRLRHQLLALLAVDAPHVYAINVEHTIQYGLTSTYGGDSPEFRASLRHTAQDQNRFWQFWQRTSTTMDALTRHLHVVAYDSLQRNPHSAPTAQERWSPRAGNGVDPGVEQFIYPIGKYLPMGFSDAQSYDPDIRFWKALAVSEYGVATYAHELTHIYDNILWFDGIPRRQKNAPEVYAKGLFEPAVQRATPEAAATYAEAPYFTLNTAFEGDALRRTNRTPDRFATRDDIGQFMRGVMDVLYTLDAMEAHAALKLSDEDKAVAFNRISQTQIPGRSATADTVTRIDASDVAGVKTLNDVIEANLVSARLLVDGANNTGTTRFNSYYKAPLFEPIYAGQSTPDGTVGEISHKRIAHELLAEYGWDKGWIGYLSDKHGDDAHALGAIMPEFGGSMTAFKKAMFERRVAKFTELKPVEEFANAAELQAAMDHALASDLQRLKANYAANSPFIFPATGVTAVRALKDRVFRAYLNATDDFRESIYQPSYTWSTPAMRATVTLHDGSTPAPIQANQFTVRITEQPTSGPGVISGVPTTGLPVAADGSVDLGKWTFTTPGTYVFTVNQVPGTDPSVVYDTEAVTLTVRAEAPAPGTPSGELPATVTYLKKGAPVGGIEFANTLRQRTATYSLGAQVTLKDEATLASLPTENRGFAVRIAAAASNDTTGYSGLPAGEVRVGSDGRAELGTLTFTKAGTYTFTVDQVAGDQPKVTYDGAVYTLTLTVTPDGQDPQRFTVASQIMRDAQPASDIHFENTLRAPVITEQRVTEKLSIPVTEEIVYDSTIVVGTPDELIRPGREGERTIVRIQRYVDGQPEGELRVESDTVTRPMETRQIRRGSKAMTLTPSAVNQAAFALAPERFTVELTEHGVAQPLTSPDSIRVQVTARQVPDGGVINGLPAEPVSPNAEGHFDALSALTFSGEGTFVIDVVQLPGTKDNVAYDVTPRTITIVTTWEVDPVHGSRHLVVKSTVVTKGEDMVSDVHLRNVRTAPQAIVEYREYSTAVVIPFTEEYVDDPTLPVGTVKIIRQGRDGVKTQYFKQMVVNGVDEGEPVLVREAVTSDMVTRLVARGTKPEAPKPEAPTPEQPKPEQPKPEAPKPEQPKPEQPKPEQPQSEQPESNTPQSNGGANVTPERQQETGDRKQSQPSSRLSPTLADTGAQTLSVIALAGVALGAGLVVRTRRR